MGLSVKLVLLPTSMLSSVGAEGGATAGDTITKLLASGPVSVIVNSPVGLAPAFTTLIDAVATSLSL